MARVDWTALSILRELSYWLHHIWVLEFVTLLWWRVDHWHIANGVCILRMRLGTFLTQHFELGWVYLNGASLIMLYVCQLSGGSHLRMNWNDLQWIISQGAAASVIYFIGILVNLYPLQRLSLSIQYIGSPVSNLLLVPILLLNNYWVWTIVISAVHYGLL